MAALAQLVEHRFCKPTVAGSTPVSSSTAWFPSGQREQTVNLPAYAFGGSNPPRATILIMILASCHCDAGVAQLVEHQPSKLGVASSNLVARSIFSGFGSRGSVVEHFLGKEEVTSSILVASSISRKGVENDCHDGCR